MSYFLRQRFPKELSIIKTYSEAEEALLDLIDMKFDILITDICMLDMSGLELIKELKKKHTFESIIVSAYHNFDYAKESIDLGVKTYLTKPIDFEKLAEIISKILLEDISSNKEELENNKYSAVIQQLIIKIDTDYYKDLQLNLLAEELHYNSAYLGQLFSKEVGQTFNAYIIHRRLEEAESLLMNSQLSVDEISNEVGFKAPAYFIRMFKHKYDTTPLQYRKLNIS